MFKTETHLHTAPVSSCSHIAPREMIRLYSEAGYTTVFVSDHFAKFHFDKFEEGLTWKEKTAKVCAAYEEAKAAGEEFGVNVLFAPELSLAGNHYLLYGIDKAFMDLREDVFTMTMEEFHRMAKAHGVTIIQAHPYRDDKCFPTPEYVDGFEAVNANPRHENHDELAFAVAAKYNLPVTAGSDAHRLEDIGLAAMLSDEPITSTQQYIELLKSGKLRLWRKDDAL